MQSDDFYIVDVDETNLAEVGIYCIKDPKSSGYKKKVEWVRNQFSNGLKIKIVYNRINNKQIGFIEYIPSEFAWRPIKATNFLFIQCIVFFVKEFRNQNIASYLLSLAEKDAITESKDGICAMSSDGAWMANKSIFEKNGFQIVDKLGRFELMSKSLNVKSISPQFYNWTEQVKNYQGWHIVYSDQCPWHDKSANDLLNAANEHGIHLTITKITSHLEAQSAPSGFGTFSLIKDGKLLEDHYISRTRFENILKKELR